MNSSNRKAIDYYKMKKDPNLVKQNDKQKSILELAKFSKDKP